MVRDILANDEDDYSSVDEDDGDISAHEEDDDVSVDESDGVISADEEDDDVSVDEGDDDVWVDDEDDDSVDEDDVPNVCRRCRKSFGSRNLLFKHLKIRGHEV